MRSRSRLRSHGAASSGEALAREEEILSKTRKIALFAAGVASQRFMTGLEEQQEIMADLAHMTSQVYALESALLRAREVGRSRAQFRRARRGHDRTAGR